ncbi:MAG TPA: YidB family protein [Hyphomicrobiales bacterium]|nr:YidB family protein [Hyphomicrobiales bacterium]
MGLFDDAMGGAVPGGNLAKPLMIAAGALLLTKLLHRDAPAAAPAGASAEPEMHEGNLAGSLGGLLDRLKNGGLGDVANSWVGTGPNASVEPGQLGAALGQDTISSIARRAGMSEQDLLAQLAQALPGLVDRLTPNGRLPQQGELPRS